ncbi:DUF2779 domain-containing protein [Pseudomonadota bacterium]
MPSIQHLSKSRVLAAMQCPKNLYLKVNNPELENLDNQTIETGNRVGEIARDVLGTPSGALVGHDQELHKAIKETTELVAAGDRPIYEATFVYEGVLVRVDLLIPENTGWQIVEVKSSGKRSFDKSKKGSKRKSLVADCAIQSWVLKGCNIPVHSISLALVDNDWAYPGDGNYKGLLTLRDVKSEVEEIENQVPDWLKIARAALTDGIPDANVGTRCNNPYKCGFWNQCWPVDEEFPVTALGGPGLVAPLVNDGIVDVRQVTRDWLDSISGNTTRQRAIKVWECTMSGRQQIDPAIHDWVASLAFPRYYLDFETVGPAIPLWAGSRPYEVTPFQYSIHIEEAPGHVTHKEFLDLSGNEPSRDLALRLINDLRDEGPVLTYSGYEQRIIEGLRNKYPDLAAPLKDVLSRLVDMMPPITECVLHPEMRGSWSIKYVAPALCPSLSYTDLEEISEGSAASEAYIEAISSDVDKDRKEKIREGLSRYCELDTVCMYEIVKVIGKLRG